MTFHSDVQLRTRFEDTILIGMRRTLIIPLLIFVSCAAHAQIQILDPKLHHLRAGEQTLKARLMNTRAGQQGLRVGQQVEVHLPPAGLVALDD